MEEEAHHVHFQEATDGMKNNDIVIKHKGEKKLEIQLGFLQIHHVYEVSFVMGKSDFVENVGDYEQEDDPVPNINCRMIRMEVSEDTIEMVIKSFKVVKIEYLWSVLQECLVLGKGNGIPMLRSEIKCLDILTDSKGMKLQIGKDLIERFSKL